MIELSLDNLSRIDSKHGLKPSDFDDYRHRIGEFLDKIHSRRQGFYEILDDSETLVKITSFVESTKGKFKYIVVLGIGGSALGTSTLLKGLRHEYSINEEVRLFILDNIDPDLIEEVEDVINLPETLFVVVTKSGNTTETIAQYFYFKDRLTKAGIDYLENMVVVTDPEEGYLREVANKEGLKSFKIPKNVGGRFSVLTPVSLLPAKLIGLQINDLIAGALIAREKFFSTKFEENQAFQIALVQYLLYLKGKSTNVIMPYSNKLSTFSNWYSQLLAESIGKEGRGITPVKAIGATDQHALSQLFHEGPNDKLIIFLRLKNFKSKIEIPAEAVDKHNYGHLGELFFGDLLNIEQVATENSLAQMQRPSLTLTLTNVTEKTLGELFMLFECATAFLGELMQIDAYNQPGVELSKQLTKEYLSKF